MYCNDGERGFKSQIAFVPMGLASKSWLYYLMCVALGKLLTVFQFPGL